ncbi:hypothetical protein H5119_03390 [Pseudoalteromonas sp. SG45-5]|uniref:hypothetical protein n=1 Tax=unclassified Pseudoalteromonas TaxID=194690 RepID=UPI0015F90C27|nr:MULTISPECIES: hypothetical protein [unclassified Pseudoalteromonas]MBB1384606.1 hypothetical protein [Pseudoalteromonas sp. SG45-5]MBB1394069.1 hypothetical protein [Pseudoalteromonas sp. SG44-4]MBB1446687.1 hypothetical protein [Pseudoalteromonas sp. SG41-6]
MKKHLFLLLILLSASTFTTQAETAINEQTLQACSVIKNDLSRLNCYDNLIAGKPLIKTSVAAQASSTIKMSDFGLEHKETHQEKDTAIKAIVATIEEAAYGELIITLDNDQQWRQIGSDSMRLKTADTIVISRGVFNSFLLKKDGQNRSIRVKRTK